MDKDPPSNKYHGNDKIGQWSSSGSGTDVIEFAQKVLMEQSIVTTTTITTNTTTNNNNISSNVQQSGHKKYEDVITEKTLAPFEQGWKREVVYRSVYKEYTKLGKPKTVPADIYYYTPDKKKLRSMVQISNYLEGKDTNLSLENFNFLRKPIYQPPFEMVRNAGSHGIRHLNSKGEFKFKSSSKPNIAKKSPKVVESPSNVGGDPISDLMDSPKFDKSPRKKFKREEKRISSWKSKSHLKRQAELSKSVTPPKKVKSVARKSTSSISKSMLVKMNKTDSYQPCSLNCPGLTGIPPQLHCDVCMCLFHNLCVDLKEEEIPKHFTCKNCEIEDSGDDNDDDGDWTSKDDSSMSNSRSDNRTIAVNQPSRRKYDSEASKGAFNGSAGYVVMNIVNTSKSDPVILSSSSCETKPLYVRKKELFECMRPTETSVIHHSISNKSKKSQSHTPSSSSSSSLFSSSLLSNDSAGISEPVPSGMFIVSNTRSTSDKDLDVSIASSPSATSSLDFPVISSSSNTSFSPPRHSQPNISSANIKIEASSLSPPVGSDNNSDINSLPRSGQLLTLPSAVAKRLDSSLPLALRINNMQLFIPPSRCINTPEGLKVFLPPKTFSVPSGSTTTMNITFSSGTVLNEGSKDGLSSPEKSKTNENSPNKTITPESVKKSRTFQKLSDRMNNYLCPFKRLYSGYSTMLQIFQYLSASDLVSCSLVCKSWHDLTTHPSLWKCIHLNNTRISDWTSAAKYFNQFAVEELSLEGMKLGNDWNRFWHQLTPVLDQLITLKRIYFDHVPALMLYTACEKLPNLQELTAKRISDINNEQRWTTPTKVDLAKFCNVKMLRKLQLRGSAGLIASFPSGIYGLIKLKHLRHLSITSLKTGDHDFDYLGELRSLKVLELGDCTNWTDETYFQLGKLVNLERLRLEVGGSLNDLSLAKALGNLKCLTHLELMLFVISDILHTELCRLTNLLKLVIWPDTAHQPALINRNTFALVTKLPGLKFLEWGIIRNKESDTRILTGTNTFEKIAHSNYKELIPFFSSEDQGFSKKTNLNESSKTHITLRLLNEKLKALLPRTKISLVQSSDVLPSMHN